METKSQVIVESSHSCLLKEKERKRPSGDFPVGRGSISCHTMRNNAGDWRRGPCASQTAVRVSPLNTCARGLRAGPRRGGEAQGAGQTDRYPDVVRRELIFKCKLTSFGFCSCCFFVKCPRNTKQIPRMSVQGIVESLDCSIIQKEPQRF